MDLRELKTLKIVSGDKVFDNLKYKEYTTSYTLNAEVITIPQYIDAYVGKQLTNGFSLSLDLYIDGDTIAEIEEKMTELRTVLISPQVCKITLPMGYAQPITVHCVKFGEKINIVEQIGYAIYSVEFHTTIDKINLPQSQTSLLDSMNNAGDGVRDSMFDFARVKNVFENVKSAVAFANTTLLDAYKGEREIFAAATEIKRYVDNITSGTENTLKLMLQGFRNTVDLPHIHSNDTEKNRLFYGNLFNTADSNISIRENPSAYMVVVGEILTSRALSLSLYIRKDDATKTQLITDLMELVAQHRKFLTFIHGNTATTSLEYFNGAFLPDVDVLNNISLLITTVFNKLQSVIFRLKQENTFITSEHMSFEVFVNRTYKPKTLAELEYHIDKLIKINNLKGENLFGILPNRSIKYII